MTLSLMKPGKFVCPWPCCGRIFTCVQGRNAHLRTHGGGPERHWLERAWAAHDIPGYRTSGAGAHAVSTLPPPPPLTVPEVVSDVNPAHLSSATLPAWHQMPLRHVHASPLYAQQQQPQQRPPFESRSEPEPTPPSLEAVTDPGLEQHAMLPRMYTYPYYGISGIMPSSATMYGHHHPHQGELVPISQGPSSTHFVQFHGFPTGPSLVDMSPMPMGCTPGSFDPTYCTLMPTTGCRHDVNSAVGTGDPGGQFSVGPMHILPLPAHQYYQQYQQYPPATPFMSEHMQFYYQQPMFLPPPSCSASSHAIAAQPPRSVATTSVAPVYVGSPFAAEGVVVSAAGTLSATSSASSPSSSSTTMLSSSSAGPHLPQ